MSDTPTFNLSAASGALPPASAQAFPRQLQFRWNGVDLGGPDATVVDFVGVGVTAARGSGVDAGKITVTIA